MIVTTIAIVLGILTTLYALWVLLYSAQSAFGRLLNLNNIADKKASINDEIDWSETSAALKLLNDRLGKAGFLSHSDRQIAKKLQVLVISAAAVLGAIVGIKSGSVLVVVVGLGVGLYLGISLWLLILRRQTNDFRREVLFQTPILLENIILLVESGLSIIPALEQVASVKDRNPVRRLLRAVYQLTTHGVPFGQALEMVADAVEIQVFRHVLLHLDISNSEGGELIPSLRNLSEHAHAEWKVSVETRVKKLENMVVFPVFLSVIGLMLLVVAVPIVPVLDVTDKLDQRQAITPGSGLTP